MNSRPRIMALCRDAEPGMLGSYARAFKALGSEVVYWDFEAAQARASRFGRLGQIGNSFFPVGAWTTKANRALYLALLDYRPDVLIVVATMRVQPGLLAQAAASLPSLKTVLLWPDTLLNIQQNTLACLPLYTVVGTYSHVSLAPLQALGARQVVWLPFAADLELFDSHASISAEDERHYGADVAFVGNHRPEREKSILALVRAGIRVKVWGGRSWKQNAAAPRHVGSYWQDELVFGEAFVKAVRCAKVALNLIDPTNYPAANMRFFEHCACAGVGLNSKCPEMEPIFLDGEACVYFSGDEDMIRKVRRLVADSALRERIRDAGHDLVTRGHTYRDRAVQLLDLLAG